MKAPKCKECEELRRFPSAVYSCFDRNHCFHEATWTKTTMGKLMTASEAKTSPKWCPKRLQGGQPNV